VREVRKSTVVLNAVGIGVVLLAGQLAQRIVPVPSVAVILETYAALCAALAAAGGLLALAWQRTR
jgi:ABC-type thiamin/hydroxymethylpyrimidine transport system permease subunit